MKSLTRKPFAVVACGFAIVLLALSATDARAQDASSPSAQQEGAASAQTNPNDTAGLLKQLNLSPEQVTQIRTIQTESVPQAKDLTQRLNRARRALDMSIYSDAADESLIEQRVRDVADAQAALLRLRAQTELRVRRVLTPEQLQTFRRLRFEARREQQEMRREQRIERQLDRGVTPKNPARDRLNNNPNRPNQSNPRTNAPADRSPNARPLQRPRQQRR